MKASAVSTITKSLPIGFPTLVNYSLLATLGYINLFIVKKVKIVSHCITEVISKNSQYKKFIII